MSLGPIKKIKSLIILVFLISFFMLATSTNAGCGTGLSRVEGLVTSPEVLVGKFPTSTSGKCVVNESKTTFTPYKLPGYEDLKLVYFTRSKADKETRTESSVAAPAIKLYNYTNPSGVTASAMNYGNITSVIFVDNNLTIVGNIQNTPGTTGGIVFIVSGKIYISTSVTRIDAVLIAQGKIYTAGGALGCSHLPPRTSASQLVINGSLVALNAANPIEFCRTYADNSQPAELINQEPKYLVLLRTLYADTLQKWSEVTTYSGAGASPPPTPPATPTPPPPTPPPPTPTPPPSTDKGVFVTSSSYSGSGIGGSLTAADIKCQSAASGATPPLTGTWKAWISDAATSAGSRIADGRYIKINDPAIVVANNKSQLISGNLAYAITWNQNGNTVSGRAWTGTDQFGVKTNINCTDWTVSFGGTGTYGDIGPTDFRWTNSATAACSGVYKLYCFEQ